MRYWQSVIVGVIACAALLVGGSLRGEVAVVAQASQLAFPAASPAVEVYETIITGRDLKNVFVTLDQPSAQAVIGFKLNDAGAARLYAFTRTNIGQPLAIVIDHRVISTPIIQGPTSYDGIIAGNFTPDEAKDLVRTMKQGMTTFEIIDPRGEYLAPGTTVVTTGSTVEQLASPVATPDSRGGR